MTFFKTNFLTFALLIILVGCSASVDDKNAGLSSNEKTQLRSDSNALEVEELSFESQNVIRENESATSSIVAKYYTLKVCVKNPNIAKGLGQRTVKVDGENYRTDSSGCIRWDHEIKLDHSLENKCRVFEKTISFSGKTSKKIRYSIDYYQNIVSDLDKTRGCLGKDGVEKKSNHIDPVTIEEVSLAYVKELSDKRSDIRYIKHETKLSTCLTMTMTGEKLRNTWISLSAQNQETGETSPSVDGKVLTKPNGCFQTSFVSSYEQFKYSHWMPVDLNLNVLSGPLKGTQVEKRIYINPWEPSRLIYGYGDSTKKPLEREFKNKYAKLHMDGVMYVQIGNDTKKMRVNDYLGLTINKTYQVILNPYLDREHRYSPNTNAIQRITREGKFKLSMVVLAPKEGDMEIDKNNFQNFEYITGAEEIVELKNGIINKVINIPFKFVDLPRLAVRAMSVFKLEPISDTGLRSSVVTGFFKARIPWIKTNVLQADGLNIPNYVDKTWQHVAKVNKPQAMTQEKMTQICSKEMNVSGDDCLAGLDEINRLDIDEKTMAYRDYIKTMFGKLSDQTKRMRTPIKASISAKDIYTNHLEKKVDGIEILNKSQLAENYDVKLKAEDFEYMFPENKRIPGFTENMAENFCRYAFHKNGKYKETFFGRKKEIPYDKCVENPYKYFAIKPVRHVEKVWSIDIEKSYTNSYAIYAGESYGVSNGEQDTEATTHATFMAADVGGKINIPFTKEFLSIGFKAGKSINWTESHSKGKGYNYAENLGTSKNLGVEKFVVNFHGSFERCFLIQSKDIVDYEAPRRRNLVKKNFGVNLYICDDRPKDEYFKEAWYFVRGRIESSIGLDFDGVTERKLMKVFRGTDSYFELRKGLRDLRENSLLTDNIAHGTPEDVLVSSWGHLLRGSGLSQKESAKFLLDHVEGAFPGTIEGNGAAGHY